MYYSNCQLSRAFVNTMVNPNLYGKVSSAPHRPVKLLKIASGTPQQIRQGDGHSERGCITGPGEGVECSQLQSEKVRSSLLLLDPVFEVCSSVMVAGCNTKESCQDLDAAASFIQQSQKLYKTLEESWKQEQNNQRINDEDRQRTERNKWFKYKGKQRS